MVAAFLRDAGMEVLYTPPWQEIGQVVRLAEEEDVDVIGISSLATDHLLVPKLMKALKKAGLEHLPVVVGGIVPDEDERKLRKAGVRHVFHPGRIARREIVSRVAELAGDARWAKDPARCRRETRGGASRHGVVPARIEPRHGAGRGRCGLSVRRRPYPCRRHHGRARRRGVRWVERYAQGEPWLLRPRQTSSLSTLSNSASILGSSTLSGSCAVSRPENTVSL